MLLRGLEERGSFFGGWAWMAMADIGLGRGP